MTLMIASLLDTINYSSDLLKWVIGASLVGVVKSEDSLQPTFLPV